MARVILWISRKIEKNVDTDEMKKIVKKDWKFLEYNILDAKGQRITFWMACLKKDLKKYMLAICCSNCSN